MSNDEIFAAAYREHYWAVSRYVARRLDGRSGEVEEVVRYLRAQGVPAYIDSVTDDPEGEEGGLAGEGGEEGESDLLYDQAIALVARERKCSTSFIQRYLQIGYNRAARIVERMEREGVVSSANHVGKREVLARDIDDRER